MNKDIFDYIEIFGSLMISMATFIFALIIYKKVSFKKNVLEKQFEVVSQLIHILQDTEIVLVKKNFDIDFSLGLSIPFFSMVISKEKFKDFKDAKIFFTHNFYSNLPFKKFARHPFLPEKIATSIDKFVISYPYKGNTDGCSKIVKIDFHNRSGENIKNEDLISSPYDIICNDFESFYSICLELDLEIKEWLKKYGIKKLNLR